MSLLEKLPKDLAPNYSMFKVSERVLLTGHSHQAWPDKAFEGHKNAFLQAADLVDDKWGSVFEDQEKVKTGYSKLMGLSSSKEVVLGQNVFQLGASFFSALPFQQKKSIITTEGEFHSLRRPLDRLRESGFQIIRNPCVTEKELDDLIPTMISQLGENTLFVLISAVFFQTGLICPHLSLLASKCKELKIPLLIDAYHALNVVPFELKKLGIENAFILGGGYKYCQLGEGNCFLRVPPGENLRPFLTGWFAEMDELEGDPSQNLFYPSGASAFLGSTFDCTSCMRAASVFDFFKEQGLEISTLRSLSQKQTNYLIELYESSEKLKKFLKLSYHGPSEKRAGFLVFETEKASEIVKMARKKGLFLDSRGTFLRLGPAPYVQKKQLEDAIRVIETILT